MCKGWPRTTTKNIILLVDPNVLASKMQLISVINDTKQSVKFQWLLCFLPVSPAWPTAATCYVYSLSLGFPLSPSLGAACAQLLHCYCFSKTTHKTSPFVVLLGLSFGTDIASYLPSLLFKHHSWGNSHIYEAYPQYPRVPCLFFFPLTPLWPLSDNHHKSCDWAM